MGLRGSSARGWVGAVLLGAVLGAAGLGAAGIGVAGLSGCRGGAREHEPPLDTELPATETAAFGALIEQLSEPEGDFWTDVPLSNEDNFTDLLPTLARARGGEPGVYIGVGPDQNLNLLTAARPELAFIVDIRRDNLLLHLLYRSMFIDARTPSEWLHLCLGRRPPEATPGAGLSLAAQPALGARDLIEQLKSAPTDDQVHAELLARTLTRMRDAWRVPIQQADEKAMRRMLAAYRRQGLDLHSTRRAQPTFETLLQSKDRNGRERHFLTDAAAFAFVRELELQGRVIPVVGDFAGERALAALARFLREHDLTVDAFYASNVEQFLDQGAQWERWTKNLERLPRAEHSLLLRTGLYTQRGAAKNRWIFGTEPLGVAAARSRPRAYKALLLSTQATDSQLVNTLTQ